MKRLLSLYIIPFVCLIVSCKKFVDVGLDSSLVDANTVFGSDLTAHSAVNGIYQSLMSSNSISSGTNRSLVAVAGLTADEINCLNPAADLLQFNRNALLADNEVILSLWESSYKAVYMSNTILEGLAKPNGVTAPTRQQLEGEALFVRAFAHFYLVNLYGDVPLVTSSDYRVNAKLPRASSADVYQQIITDLVAAKEKLNNEYSGGTTDRVRPNKAAAIALLARVYLYTGNWSKAVEESSLVIADPAYQVNIPLTDVFKSTSGEAIWQLKPVQAGYNTWEGVVFILEGSPVTNTLAPYAMTPELYAAFDDADLRKQQWTGTYTEGPDTWHFSYKYKISSGTNVTEYSMVLRLAEQYLIRAEAKARSGDFAGAQDDINVIRARAGLSNTTASDEPTLISAIEQERRAELFTEYGHRWLDLKRWGRADAVLSTIKMDWNPEDTLYPVPRKELRTNPNLKTQNPGYTD